MVGGNARVGVALDEEHDERRGDDDEGDDEEGDPAVLAEDAFGAGAFGREGGGAVCLVRFRKTGHAPAVGDGDADAHGQQEDAGHERGRDEGPRHGGDAEAVKPEARGEEEERREDFGTGPGGGGGEEVDGVAVALAKVSGQPGTVVREVRGYVRVLQGRERAGGRVALRVHQVVTDTAGAVVLDTKVAHVYTLEDGPLRRVDIE